MPSSKCKPAAQVEPSKKAAALKAAYTRKRNSRPSNDPSRLLIPEDDDLPVAPERPRAADQPRGPPAVIPAPKTLHLDKRASAILASSAGDDDDLLSTRQMAMWLQVSEQWLEIGRHRGYGPPFERLGPRLIRYRRGKARKWLDQRSHFSTAEYRDESGPFEAGRS